MQNVTVDRDKYIGGSDVPIIMGISSFKTRWQLLQEKAGLLENDFKGNVYTEYGNILEPQIRDFINKSKKDKFVEGKDIVDDIRCHTDGINKTTVLEIKTTSQIHENLEDYKVYLVQLLFYMKYTNRKKGLLAVYERPQDFNEEFDEKNLKTYEVNIKDYKELLEDIDTTINQFRNDLDKIRENPFLTEEDLLPKEIIKLSEKVEFIENKLVEFKKLEEESKTLKASLKSAMEKYQIKKWVTNNDTKITLIEDKEDKEVTVEYYDEDKFIEENPELHEKYHNKLAEYKKTKTEIKKGKTGYILITLSESK